MKKPLIHLGIAIAVLALSIAGYGFWYMALQAKSGDLGTVTQQISQDAVETTRVEQAKNELESLAEDKATVDQYFISTNDVVPFLESLQSTGKYLRSDVEVVSVSAAPGTPFGQLSLSLKIIGSFNAVERTIGSIEYGPYDTKLTSLTLDADDAVGSSTPEWNAAAVFTIGTLTSTGETAPATSSSVPPSTPAPENAPVPSAAASTSAAGVPETVPGGSAPGPVI